MLSSHVGEKGHTVAFECFAAAQAGTGPGEWSMARDVSHCTTSSSHVLPRCPAAARGTYLMDGSAHTATSASGPLPMPGVIELWMRATGKPSPHRGFAEPCQCPGIQLPGCCCHLHHSAQFPGAYFHAQKRFFSSLYQAQQCQPNAMPSRGDSSSERNDSLRTVFPSPAHALRYHRHSALPCSQPGWAHTCASPQQLQVLTFISCQK